MATRYYEAAEQLRCGGGSRALDQHAISVNSTASPAPRADFAAVVTLVALCGLGGAVVAAHGQLTSEFATSSGLRSIATDAREAAGRGPLGAGAGAKVASRQLSTQCGVLANPNARRQRILYAVGAAVPVLLNHHGLHGECVAIVGDDFSCRRGSACRGRTVGEGLVAAAREQCSAHSECVAVVGSPAPQGGLTIFTFKARHAVGLSLQCRRVVADVHAEGSCHTGHARAWARARCRGATPWPTDLNLHPRPSGVALDNSTYDGDVTLSD